MYSALVCDDEKAQREGLAHHVHWADYGFETPVLCANAWEALRAMETRTFDLLMTDVRMPGKDGLELAAECHARQSDLYIVMISSYAEFDYARSAMKNGAREYLLKPIRPSDVHGILSAFLQWKSTGDESGISTDANAQRAMQLLEEHVEEGITIARLARFSRKPTASPFPNSSIFCSRSAPASCWPPRTCPSARSARAPAGGPPRTSASGSAKAWA